MVAVGERERERLGVLADIFRRRAGGRACGKAREVLGILRCPKTSYQKKKRKKKELELAETLPTPQYI